MNLDKYLARIGYTGSRLPDSSTLRALQVAHLYSVPFENLSIHLGQPIILDRTALYRKIVDDQRGGFCYEVNGTFSWLLQQLGFDVTLLSASDANADGTFGPEYDHLALLVKCPADESPEIPWLADVGWGDSFLNPLRLDTDAVQSDVLHSYRIEQNGERRILWQQSYEGVWERQYGFTLTPRAFSEFADMCLYHQTSPDSPFTRKRIVSRARPDGRISLDNSRLIITRNGVREVTDVSDIDQYHALLSEHFSVALTSPFIDPLAK